AAWEEIAAAPEAWGIVERRRRRAPAGVARGGRVRGGSPAPSRERGEAAGARRASATPGNPADRVSIDPPEEAGVGGPATAEGGGGGRGGGGGGRGGGGGGRGGGRR